MAEVRRLALVGCSKKKGPIATKAKELYQGDLFKKSLLYGMRTCDAVMILSAKYGLVDPDQIIDPYEQTLNRMAFALRMQWAKSVTDSLRQKYPDWIYVYLAGSRYVEFLPEGEVPMKGLAIGQRLAWLK